MPDGFHAKVACKGSMHEHRKKKSTSKAAGRKDIERAGNQHIITQYGTMHALHAEGYAVRICSDAVCCATQYLTRIAKTCMQLKKQKERV